MPLPKTLSRVAGRAGEAALQQLQHLRLPGVGQSSVTDDARTSARRWRVVTVLCPPGRLESELPAPIAAFGDRLEVRTTPAPGDRGTELAARFRDPVSDDEIGELRAALRQAKQLVEVGELLRVDPQPHGRRAETPQGRALDGMVARAPKEGVL
jgi:hypothetical protein